MFQVFFVVVVAVSAFQFSHAYSPQRQAEISQQLNPIAINCAKTSGVSQDQLKAARVSKNINSFSACFFLCFFQKVGVIKSSPYEGLDIPTTLIFAQKYIPTINLLNVVQTSAVVLRCDTAFQKAPGSDSDPGCPKTRVLTDCLSGSKFLNNLIKLAIKSNL